MATFKRCVLNSPLCTGMTDYCYCDSHNCIADKKIPVKRKQLSLSINHARVALSPSKQFNRTVSKEVAQIAGLQGFILANLVRSTRWALRAIQDWADQ